jgi:ABC-type amino acid transport system permease subunit
MRHERSQITTFFLVICFQLAHYVVQSVLVAWSAAAYVILRHFRTYGMTGPTGIYITAIHTVPVIICLYLASFSPMLNSTGHRSSVIGHRLTKSLREVEVCQS